MDDYAQHIRERLTEEGRSLLEEVEQAVGKIASGQLGGEALADHQQAVVEKMEQLPQADRALIAQYLETDAAGRRAAMDQYESGTHDIERIAELCGKASFPTDGMNVGQIVERMAAVGDITADERREVYEITERIPVIEVPRDSEE